MTDQGFKALWSDRDLYSDSFIKKFGLGDSHWSFSSDQSRESSLRHDMVCTLLCNQETMARPREEEIEEMNLGPSTSGNQSKKSRLELEATFSGSESITSEGEIDYMEEECNLPSASDNDSEEEVVSKEIEKEPKFRYVLLEGNIKAAQIQNHYCKEFGILDKYTELFDIVDRKNQIFIEVKVSLRPSNRIKEFEAKHYTLRNEALFVIDPKTYATKSLGLSEDLPGTSKAITWLTKRKGEMNRLQLSDSSISEVFSLSKAIFHNEFINEEIKIFEDVCFRHTGDEYSTVFPTDEQADLCPLRPASLFEKLDDPTLYEGPTVKWKGIISPPSITSHTKALPDDLSNVKGFLFELSESSKVPIFGATDPIDALNEALTYFFDNMAIITNFNFYRLKGSFVSPELGLLKKMVGINRKQLVYNDEAKDLVQPEYAPLGKHRYHTWFEDVYKNLNEQHPFPGEIANYLSFEKKEYLEMGAIFQEIISTTMKEVGKTNMGVMVSQCINFGSRVSGSYLVGSGKNSSHNSIAVLPIIANLYNEETKEPFRIISGIAFRAPHHARDANDNINLFIVERIDKSKCNPENFVMYNKYTLMEGKDYNYLLRQTAIKKNIAVHWSFLNNSYFNALNLLGELLLNNIKIDNIDKLTQNATEFVRDERKMKFLLHRVTESCLMAIIGNARDEGYIALARKLFMVMLEWRRHQLVFSWNMEEFASKLNENLIDNPLSMYFHMNLKYIIACYGTDPDFSCEF